MVYSIDVVNESEVQNDWNPSILDHTNDQTNL